MNNFEKVYPNKSYILINIFAVSSMLYFFQLSWMEMLMGLVLDTVMFVVMHPPERKLFFKLFPYLEYVNKLDAENNTVTDLQQQNKIFSDLTKLPWIRCNYTFILNLIKVAPVGIFIALRSTNGFSFSENLLFFYFVDCFVLFYFYGLLYIQLHKMTSDLMARMLSNPHWVDNYKHLRLESSNDQFSKVQNSVLTCMLINLLLIVISSRYFQHDISPISLTCAFISAVVGLIVIQRQFQSLFREALQGIFDKFTLNLKNEKTENVPLHTSPLLAGFEYSFNQLGSKLSEREEEVAQWLKYESEQYHLRTLGEITGLVAHDIKTPLHVMQMSLEIMKDPESSEQTREKYLAILERNLGQTISFTQTLMAYLKGAPEDKLSSFGDVHFHLLDLLRTQFPIAKFMLIDFEVMSELKELNLQVNRLDAMHVFYNLYHNAIKTVVELEGTKQIKVWAEVEDGHAAIYLYNNGPVMPVETFKQLIGFERSGLNKGLGLRLTHTMVKHLGGTLDVVPISEGACFKVTLPVAQEQLISSSSQSSLSLS